MKQLEGCNLCTAPSSIMWYRVERSGAEQSRAEQCRACRARQSGVQWKAWVDGWAKLVWCLQYMVSRSLVGRSAVRLI